MTPIKTYQVTYQFGGSAQELMGVLKDLETKANGVANVFKALPQKLATKYGKNSAVDSMVSAYAKLAEGQSKVLESQANLVTNWKKQLSEMEAATKVAIQSINATLSNISVPAGAFKGLEALANLKTGGAKAKGAQGLLPSLLGDYGSIKEFEEDLKKAESRFVSTRKKIQTLKSLQREAQAAGDKLVGFEKRHGNGNGKNWVERTTNDEEARELRKQHKSLMDAKIAANKALANANNAAGGNIDALRGKIRGYLADYRTFQVQNKKIAAAVVSDQKQKAAGGDPFNINVNVDTAAAKTALEKLATDFKSLSSQFVIKPTIQVDAAAITAKLKDIKAEVLVTPIVNQEGIAALQNALKEVKAPIATTKQSAKTKAAKEAVADAKLSLAEQKKQLQQYATDHPIKIKTVYETKGLATKLNDTIKKLQAKAKEKSITISANFSADGIVAALDAALAKAQELAQSKALTVKTNVLSENNAAAVKSSIGKLQKQTDSKPVAIKTKLTGGGEVGEALNLSIGKLQKLAEGKPLTIKTKLIGGGEAGEALSSSIGKLQRLANERAISLHTKLTGGGEMGEQLSLSLGKLQKLADTKPIIIKTKLDTALTSEQLNSLLATTAKAATNLKTGEKSSSSIVAPANIKPDIHASVQPVAAAPVAEAPKKKAKAQKAATDGLWAMSKSEENTYQRAEAKMADDRLNRLWAQQEVRKANQRYYEQAFGKGAYYGDINPRTGKRVAWDEKSKSFTTEAAEEEDKRRRVKARVEKEIRQEKRTASAIRQSNDWATNMLNPSGQNWNLMRIDMEEKAQKDVAKRGASIQKRMNAWASSLLNPSGQNWNLMRIDMEERAKAEAKKQQKLKISARARQEIREETNVRKENAWISKMQNPSGQNWNLWRLDMEQAAQKEIAKQEKQRVSAKVSQRLKQERSTVSAIERNNDQADKMLNPMGKNQSRLLKMGMEERAQKELAKQERLETSTKAWQELQREKQTLERAVSIGKRYNDWATEMLSPMGKNQSALLKADMIARNDAFIARRQAAHQQWLERDASSESPRQKRISERKELARQSRLAIHNEQELNRVRQLRLSEEQRALSEAERANKMAKAGSKTNGLVGSAALRRQQLIASAQANNGKNGMAANIRRNTYPLTGNTSFGARTPVALDMAKGMGMMFAVSGVMSAVTDSFHQVAEYDNLMKTVRAILQTTDKGANFNGRFEAMENTVREVGRKTKFTAPEVAGAARFMAMAGLNIENINAATEPIANLALIGDTELSDTADKMANIMTSFGLLKGLNAGQQKKNMIHTSDVLTNTFTRSNTDMLQLAEAMQYAGPMSHLFGTSLEDAAAMVGVMGNAGIQASMAGTSLRMMYQNIVKPNKNQTKEWERLGITRTDKNGNIRPIFEILKDLRAKLTGTKDLNARIDPETLKSLGTGVMSLFRTTAGSGVAALLKNLGEAEAIANTNRSANGVAAKIADEKKNTIAGLWAQVTSTFTDQNLTVATDFQNTIKQILTDLRDWLSSTEAAETLRSIYDLVNSVLNVFKEVAKMWIGMYRVWPGFFKGLIAVQFALSQIGALMSPFVGLLSVAGSVKNTIMGVAGAFGALNTAAGVSTVGVNSVSSVAKAVDAKTAAVGASVLSANSVPSVVKAVGAKTAAATAAAATAAATTGSTLAKAAFENQVWTPVSTSASSKWYETVEKLKAGGTLTPVSTSASSEWYEKVEKLKTSRTLPPTPISTSTGWYEKVSKLKAGGMWIPILTPNSSEWHEKVGKFKAVQIPREYTMPFHNYSRYNRTGADAIRSLGTNKGVHYKYIAEYIKKQQQWEKAAKASGASAKRIAHATVQANMYNAAITSAIAMKDARETAHKKWLERRANTKLYANLTDEQKAKAGAFYRNMRDRIDARHRYRVLSNATIVRATEMGKISRMKGTRLAFTNGVAAANALSFAPLVANIRTGLMSVIAAISRGLGMLVSPLGLAAGAIAGFAWLWAHNYSKQKELFKKDEELAKRGEAGRTISKQAIMGNVGVVGTILPSQMLEAPKSKMVTRTRNGRTILGSYFDPMLKNSKEYRGAFNDSIYSTPEQYDAYMQRFADTAGALYGKRGMTMTGQQMMLSEMWYQKRRNKNGIAPSIGSLEGNRTLRRDALNRLTAFNLGSASSAFASRKKIVQGWINHYDQLPENKKTPEARQKLYRNIGAMASSLREEAAERPSVIGRNISNMRATQVAQSREAYEGMAQQIEAMKDYVNSFNTGLQQLAGMMTFQAQNIHGQIVKFNLPFSNGTLDWNALTLQFKMLGVKFANNLNGHWSMMLQVFNTIQNNAELAKKYAGMSAGQLAALFDPINVGYKFNPQEWKGWVVDWFNDNNWSGKNGYKNAEDFFSRGGWRTDTSLNAIRNHAFDKMTGNSKIVGSSGSGSGANSTTAGGGAHGAADQSKYDSKYKNHRARPTQIIFNIDKLCNFSNTTINDTKNLSTAEGIGKQLSIGLQELFAQAVSEYAIIGESQG